MKKNTKIGLIMGTAITIIVATYLIFIRKPKKDLESGGGSSSSEGTGSNNELGGEPESGKGTSNASTLTMREVTAILKAKKGTVTASTLNVRSEPSTSGKILTKIKKGQVVNILSYYNSGWFKIDLIPFYNTDLYVSADYIK